MIIIRKAPASGTTTNNGINGFIFYPLKLLISLISSLILPVNSYNDSHHQCSCCQTNHNCCKYKSLWQRIHIYFYWICRSTMGATPASIYPIRAKNRKLLNSIIDNEIAILIRFLRYHSVKPDKKQYETKQVDYHFDTSSLKITSARKIVRMEAATSIPTKML